MSKAKAEAKPFDTFDYPGDLPIGRYVPGDWYWQVKDDLGFVWSSARAARVPISDLTFKTWLAEGRGMVTLIPSFEDMRDVWAGFGAFLDPVAQYRLLRADRYVKELGKQGEGEQASFEKTVGDVLDVLIAQVAHLSFRAGAGAPVPEFAELLTKIQRIKDELPKPQAPAA
jgi:hypothetical protein